MDLPMQICADMSLGGIVMKEHDAFQDVGVPLAWHDFVLWQPSGVQAVR
jgi:hypothetical protein